MRAGGRARAPRIVDAEQESAVATVRERGDERVVGVDDDGRVGRRGVRPQPASARRCARARRSGRAGRGRGCRGTRRAVGCAASPRAARTRRPRAAPGPRRAAASSVEATPEARFAPEWFQARRCVGERIALAIAVVVVLPFVAETSATPWGSRAASASRAPGSSFQTSLPGSVVPPPRPAARESRPTSRAADVSSASRAPTASRLPRQHASLWLSCNSSKMLYHDCMARSRRRHPALEGIDERALAEFRAGLRRRYTDEEILAELRASAARLGRSPTMREFAADPEAGVHPQTVIEHFGTWNAAKRAAGLRRGGSSAARSWSRSCGSWGRSSDGRRPCATSRSAAGRWRRSRSSGTRSARSRRP